jgi:hypothetical protein
VKNKGQSMKRKISLFILIIIILTFAVGISACKSNKTNSESIIIIFDGDIENGYQSIDLSKISKIEYSYKEDNEDVKGQGWDLEPILETLKMHSNENYLLITSASDGVSAKIDANLTDKLYIYQDSDGLICTKGPKYPRCTGIKNISEITVIAKDSSEILNNIESTPNYKSKFQSYVNYGIKILTPLKTDLKTFGSAKLNLFSLSAENEMLGNLADKYLINKTLSVDSFTGRSNNIAYLENGDIVLNSDNLGLSWKQGKLFLEGKDSPILGFTTNVTKTILDAYSEMKKSIDNDEKVMLIIPDGFSWIQAQDFEADLDILKASLAKSYVTSTNRAISPVALASILTGKTPFVTKINFAEGESRAVLKPQAEDIFEYATKKDKKVKYIEGSGNLIITSVEPKYSLNDNAVYQNTKQAITSGDDLIVTHFHEIDDINHEYGANSSEAKSKCIEIDSYIKDLKNQFSGKIIIVPDHGHIPLIDEDNKNYGDHGYFDYQDMYVPYFIFN